MRCLHRLACGGVYIFRRFAKRTGHLLGRLLFRRNVDPVGTVSLSVCRAVGPADPLQPVQRLCSNKPFHLKSIENPPVKAVQLTFQQRPRFLRFSNARVSIDGLFLRAWNLLAC